MHFLSKFRCFHNNKSEARAENDFGGQQSGIPSSIVNFSSQKGVRAVKLQESALWITCFYYECENNPRLTELKIPHLQITLLPSKFTSH